MGRYYNKGRGNLPLTLSGGRSTSVPGNKWIELNGLDETTPSVMRAVRKGQLHRALDAVPATDPVEVKTPAPAVDETSQDSAPAESKPQTAAMKQAASKKVAKKKARAKRARSSK